MDAVTKRETFIVTVPEGGGLQAWFADGRLLAVSSQDREGWGAERIPFLVFPLEGTDPISGISWPDHLLTPSHWGLGFPHMLLGDADSHVLTRFWGSTPPQLPPLV